MKIWKTKLKIWNDLLHVPWRRRRAVENCPAHPRWSRNLQSASAEKQAVNCFSWRLDVQAVAGGRRTSDKNVIKIQQGFFFSWPFPKAKKRKKKISFIILSNGALGVIQSVIDGGGGGLVKNDADKHEDKRRHYLPLFSCFPSFPLSSPLVFFSSSSV